MLYHNNGDGTFTDVSEKAGVAGSAARWGAGCCFLDYDRDGHLDLFVANYVNFDPAKAPRPGESAYCRYNEIPVPCGPLGFAGGTNVLYRNRGDGTFADVSEASGIASPRGPSSMVFVSSNWRPTGSYGMGAAAADFDNDGWPDIYVACDTAPSLLYRNNHDGTFREVAVPAGLRLRRERRRARRHGRRRRRLRRRRLARHRPHELLGAGDHALPQLRRRPFEDASIRAGLGVNRKYVGFGVDFFDFDNDGWKDIFIANGHVYSQIAGRKLHLTLPAAEARSTAIWATGASRTCPRQAGAAIRRREPRPRLRLRRLRQRRRRRRASSTTWTARRRCCATTAATGTTAIMIKCVGTRSNRSAIGARVKVTSGGRSQIDEVMSGSSYYSQSDFRLHFGLGARRRPRRVEVAWPSGVKETFGDLPANHSFVIQETKGIVSRRAFGAARTMRMRVRLRAASVLACTRRCSGRVAGVDVGCPVHRHHGGGRHRLHARELRHLEQVPDRDHGRRRRAARLRQRRPARHVLHERREDSRIRCRTAKRPTSRDPEVLEPALPPERRTARSPT